MRAAIILAPVLLALALAGICADAIAPKHPKLENLILNLLDRIM